MSGDLLNLRAISARDEVRKLKIHRLMSPTRAAALCLALCLSLQGGFAIRIGRPADSDEAQEPPAVKLGRKSRESGSAPATRSAASSGGDGDADASGGDEGAVTASTSTSPATSSKGPLLVVGSLNVDLICEVERLPVRGENIEARSPNITKALGGKGANQAIAAARLSKGTSLSTQFVCQFGDDEHAPWLKSVLASNGCDLTLCGRAQATSSGTGLVLLEAQGDVAAVVVGGSNAAWSRAQAEALTSRVRAASALLLQREIPEEVRAWRRSKKRRGLSVPRGRCH